MKFFLFSCIFCISQPHKSTLPEMGKCFTTIVGQSVWLRYCYWLSCLTYTALDKVRGRIARAENNLLHNVNAQVYFTTECKLHANAYCQESLLKTWKVINADRCSASLALEPRFVPFWWWTGSAELSASNSSLYSCGRWDQPRKLCLFDRTARGRFWKEKDLCAKAWSFWEPDIFDTTVGSKCFAVDVLCIECTHSHRMHSIAHENVRGHFASVHGHKWKLWASVVHLYLWQRQWNLEGPEAGRSKISSKKRSTKFMSKIKCFELLPRHVSWKLFGRFIF